MTSSPATPLATRASGAGLSWSSIMMLLGSGSGVESRASADSGYTIAGREREIERTPLSRRTLDPDAPAVRGDDRFRYGQAQADTEAPAFCFRLPIGVEKVGELVGRN